MNISLSEILLILVVALMVIKPEQMPGVAFKLGKWMKSLRGTLGQLRQEVDSALNPLAKEVSSLTALPEKTEASNDAEKIS